MIISIILCILIYNILDIIILISEVMYYEEK